MLDQTVKLTGDSKTDAINWALQVYTYLEDKNSTVRRLGRAAMFSAVRGLASGAGAALLAWITWRIQSR